MAAIDAARWGLAKECFAEVVGLPAERRAERLEHLRRTDPELSRQLERLLAADAAAESRTNRFDLTPLGSTDPTSSPDSRDGTASPTNDPFGLTGRTVAHFRVEHVLGAGGMGVVYEAEDVRLGRKVALKFLLPQLALDPGARERFVREARAASELDHPNICTILEATESVTGQLFLVMPRYRGETLRSLLAESGALTVERTLDITRQILSGLRSAHVAGIVHRDLKPANLLITMDGTVKILDFGVAKVRDLSRMSTGALAGTVAYMSPEQLRDGPVGPPADLWAVGALMYEMLTGRTPFRGGHDLSTVYAILHEEPAPLWPERENAPDALSATIEKLLRKNVSERFATADEVMESLAAGRRGRRRHLDTRVIVTAAAIVAGLVVGTTVAVPGARSRTATLFSALAGRAAVGEPSAEAPAGASSVAVLPFRNLGPDPEQDYFSDGITEEVINALSSIPELRVPARASSFFFKGRDLPLRDIADQLQVATVLEGSVRREGSRVRIIAQLIDVATDRQLWSQTFDREVVDVFAVQSEIAAAVAGALQVRLAAQQRIAVVAVDPLAHDLYLRGLFLWNRRAATDLEQAIRFFREAIRIDPDFTLAHAGVALAYAVLPIAFGATITVAEAASEVEAAARRTLELDPDNAEARAALGYSLHWRWRWADAEREFTRAIESNPDYATARQWYGELLAKTGNAELAETQLRRAVTLDPLSLVVNGDLGLVLMFARKYREAVAQLEHTSSMDRGFAIPYFMLHRIHLHSRQYDEAERAGRIWAELTGAVDPDDIVTLTRALAGAVDRSAAILVLNDWEARPTPRYMDIAAYYSLLNLTDEAIVALQEAVRRQHPMSTGIGLVPWFDNIRGDPRFQTLLRTMGLPYRAMEAA